MRYIVGYGPKQRGIDGINLAATMARSSGASLDLVTVLPDDAPTFHMYSPDHAYNVELEKQGEQWLADGLSRVPEGLKSEGRVRRAESITEALIAEAEDPERANDDDMIVVGAAHHIRLGSIVGSLLHSAPVPVALAPTGYEGYPAITRITCATGMREGHEALLDFAIRSAAAWRVPLRLMSLAAVGEDGSGERRTEWTELAGVHVASLAEKAERELPAECPVTTIVGHGKTLKGAVKAQEFTATEVVMFGSSRLAQPRHLFVGRTANTIMRVLRVPMIVVPRDF